MFDDPSVGKAGDSQDRAVDFFPGSWKAHVVPEVRGTGGHACNDTITFGHNVLDMEIQVRKSLHKPSDDVLDAFETMVVLTSVVNHVWGPELAQPLQVSSIPSFHVLSYEFFILFGAHGIPPFDWVARHQLKADSAYELSESLSRRKGGVFFEIAHSSGSPLGGKTPICQA
jgi:hypothetical protein